MNGLAYGKSSNVLEKSLPARYGKLHLQSRESQRILDNIELIN